MELPLLLRIIVSGPMMDVIVPNSAQVFRYDQEYQLNQDLLKKVRVYLSPVELFLQVFDNSHLPSPPNFNLSFKKEINLLGHFYIYFHLHTRNHN